MHMCFFFWTCNCPYPCMGAWLQLVHICQTRLCCNLYVVAHFFPWRELKWDLNPLSLWYRIEALTILTMLCYCLNYLLFTFFYGEILNRILVLCTPCIFWPLCITISYHQVGCWASFWDFCRLCHQVIHQVVKCTKWALTLYQTLHVERAPYTRCGLLRFMRHRSSWSAFYQATSSMLNEKVICLMNPSLAIQETKIL